jgi:1,4-dihydroxy-2-naphthoyl-CoA hydrolase
VASPLFAMPRTVRFQDIDAAGILFYARAFEYFHDAYLALLEDRGIDVPARIRERTWGAPLGHAEADFKAPMRYGDRIVVDIDGGTIGKTSLTVAYTVRSATDPTRVFCTGKTVHIFIEVPSLKPRDVPDEVRTAFAGAAV